MSIKIIFNGVTYEKCFERAEWSGDIKTSTRKLEITYLKDRINLELGKEVQFLVDDYIVFTGDVFSITKNTLDETITAIIRDKGIRLTKNFLLRTFSNQTPSEITKSVLSEIGLEVGNLPADVTRCTYPAWDRSAYDIILTAYKFQHMKDKKIYSIICSPESKIEVVEQGVFTTDVVLNSFSNIRQADYTEDIEELVNKVVYYTTEKDKPQILNTVQNEEDIKKFGVFQVMQEQDKDNAAYVETNKILKSVNETSSLIVDGNLNLISGYNVPIKFNQITRLNGVFLIASDRHVWESGDYTTELELAFINEMNDVEIDNQPKKKKPKKQDEEETTAGNLWDVGG